MQVHAAEDENPKTYVTRGTGPPFLGLCCAQQAPVAGYLRQKRNGVSMSEDPFAAPVRRKAQRLLAAGPYGDELVYLSGVVAQPVPVLDAQGQLHSWFVPVTVGDKLASFMELLPDLSLARYSSFQHTPRTLTGCPDAALWLDKQAIRHRVRARLRPGEQVGVAVLTFDDTPQHLAWAVTVTNHAGGSRTIFVRGEEIYEREPQTEGAARDRRI